MLSMEPIGYVRSPYQNTGEIPKGLGAKHDAEGVLEIRAEFEPGLRDIEGFSHLFVIWAFDRSEGFDPVGTPPNDDRPHGVFATRSPRRPNPIGLTVVELLYRQGPLLHVRGVDMLEGTFSTSSPISQAFRRNGCDAGGSRKRKHVPKWSHSITETRLGTAGTRFRTAESESWATPCLSGVIPSAVGAPFPYRRIWGSRRCSVVRRAGDCVPRRVQSKWTSPTRRRSDSGTALLPQIFAILDRKGSRTQRRRKRTANGCSTE